MPRILMVCTEYPPMKGGVGRYTANLVQALRQRSDMEVQVVCSHEGAGDFDGLSPDNKQNSEVLLRLIDKVKPDIVHVQFEPGLYGLVLDPGNPSRSMTHIDSFYERCRVPIVTTFHSAYTFGQWMGQSIIVKRQGRTGRLGVPARAAVRAWKSLVNYKAFHDINKEKLRQSAAGISFSHYMAQRIGGGSIIYHGAEPAISPLPSRVEARSRFSLPQDAMIAIALGFGTATKGWDILERIHLPSGWKIVVNSAKSHYNRENLGDPSKDKNQIIHLQLGFLSEQDLSLLLLASDAVLLPYKITSGSGVMFDALAHGLPFVATDLEFFTEFASMGLGITAKRTPAVFSQAIARLARDYQSYRSRVESFRKELLWAEVASRHAELYLQAAGKSVGPSTAA